MSTDNVKKPAHELILEELERAPKARARWKRLDAITSNLLINSLEGSCRTLLHLLHNMILSSKYRPEIVKRLEALTDKCPFNEDPFKGGLRDLLNETIIELRKPTGD